ncbi:4394_t:CDS:2, partial [Entrophospora sp. SA101]
KRKEQEITILEEEIFHLTNLIDQLKTKIVEVPASLLAEKELKRELIQAHSKYIQAKKQNFLSLILNDCGELISLELELENKKLEEYKNQRQEQTTEVSENEDISFHQEVSPIVWQHF